MKISLIILASLLESFWRRWFGGGYIGGKSKENSWYNKRGFQHLINCILLLSSLYFLKSFNIYYCLIITAVIEGLYWSRGHGPAFDISRNGKPDSETLKRYKKEWWNKICEFFVPKKFWYGYGYDMWWMTLRYTIYLIPLIYFYGITILFLGILVSVTYSFCWSLSEKYQKLFKTKFFTKYLQIDAPTALAEYLVGFITGLFLLL